MNTFFISEILFKLKNFWSSYVKISYGPVYWDTDRQVAIVAMETMQVVLSQFKNFLTYWTENWIRSVCAKTLVNWWSYVILIVAVRFFETECI